MSDFKKSDTGHQHLFYPPAIQFREVRNREDFDALLDEVGVLLTQKITIPNGGELSRQIKWLAEIDSFGVQHFYTPSP